MKAQVYKFMMAAVGVLIIAYLVIYLLKITVWVFKFILPVIVLGLLFLLFLWLFLKAKTSDKN